MIKGTADLELYVKSRRTDVIEVLQQDGGSVMRQRTVVVLEHPRPVAGREVSPEVRCTLEVLEPYVLAVDPEQAYRLPHAVNAPPEGPPPEGSVPVPKPTRDPLKLE